MTETPEGVVVTLKREIERQCGIGAGSFTVDDGVDQSGLWQINADLDPNGLQAALAHTPTLRGEEVERLRSLHARATPGKWRATEHDGSVWIDADDDGDMPVALIMSGSPHQQDRIDAAFILEAVEFARAALSQPLAVDTGQSVPAGWIGWSGGAVPVQGTGTRGLILFKGEAVEQAEERGEAVLDHWPWYDDCEQPLAVAYKLATPAPDTGQSGEANDDVVSRDGERALLSGAGDDLGEADGGQHRRLEQRALDAVRSAFFTSVSEAGRYFLSLKYPTMQAMHDADDAIKAWARETTPAPSVSPDPAGEVERHLSHETVCGFKVAAYREAHPEHGAKYGHHYSEHWSTPNNRDPRVKVERLFTEDQLRAALASSHIPKTFPREAAEQALKTLVADEIRNAREAMRGVDAVESNYRKGRYDAAQSIGVLFPGAVSALLQEDRQS